MPFGIRSSKAKPSLKFSKKKTYSVREHHAPPHGQGEDKGLIHSIKSSGSLALGSRGRRNTAPTGILKRGGSRPVSYPALEDGMVPQEMAAAIPMPTEGELNELFEDMVVSLSDHADPDYMHDGVCKLYRLKKSNFAV